MKYLLLVQLVFIFSFCSKGKSKPQTQSGAESTATTSALVDGAAPQNPNPKVMDGLVISLPSLKAKTGEAFCLDVAVRNFQALLSMQYTIRWDRNVLEFIELKNFALPYLDANDFGTTRTAEGILTSAWIDDSLKGTSVEDGTSVYQICYRAKGKAGQSTFLKITDVPTAIEVVNKMEKVIPMKKENGSVKIE